MEKEEKDERRCLRLVKFIGSRYIIIVRYYYYIIISWYKFLNKMNMNRHFEN